MPQPIYTLKEVYQEGSQAYCPDKNSMKYTQGVHTTFDFKVVNLVKKKKLIQRCRTEEN